MPNDPRIEADKVILDYADVDKEVDAPGYLRYLSFAGILIVAVGLTTYWVSRAHRDGEAIILVAAGGSLYAAAKCLQDTHLPIAWRTCLATSASMCILGMSAAGIESMPMNRFAAENIALPLFVMIPCGFVAFLVLWIICRFKYPRKNRRSQ